MWVLTLRIFSVIKIWCKIRLKVHKSTHQVLGEVWNREREKDLIFEVDKPNR